ncbi:selenoprotein H-like [Carica papaya]|uniref:selenoprotein H-like n=1 Tax=Carica papaya TaxID=3649 RepID=UPI000B8CC5F9|nr:selenoprotein H-like [Carica papaya]
MAPRKRKADEDKMEPEAAASVRVTRSMAKAKGAPSKSTASTRELPKPRSKKAKAVENAKDTGESAKEVGPDRSKNKTIVVEHCTQCRSFKTRALDVKGGLEKGVPEINVILNPEKPRRGCFEIREEGGKTFISLLNMKRPFEPMKKLDMEKVVSDIIKEIK